jgi:hypothetical protein
VVPADEALKVSRPAAGEVANALASAVSYTAGARSCRSGCAHVMADDWPTGSGPIALGQLTVTYRPSLMASALWVGIYYGSANALGPPAATVELLDDAGAAVTAAVDLRPAATSANVPEGDSGILSGREALASVPWSDLLDATQLAGQQGWIRVDFENIAPMAVVWAELPPGDVA